jgi:hypothetical protein
MYLNAESVKVDSDDGRITLEVFGYANTPDADAVTLTILIQDIDLDAFYDSVRSGIGGYLRERDEARGTLPVAAYDAREAYDLSDPKHPEFHSVHADIWDARDGK